MMSKKKKIATGIVGSLLVLTVLLGIYKHRETSQETVLYVQNSLETQKQEEAEQDSRKDRQPAEEAEQNTQKEPEAKQDIQEEPEGENGKNTGEIQSEEAEQGTQKEIKTEEEIFQEKVSEKLSAMSLEEKAAQLFIITPEALTGYGSVTQAGDATRTALNEYPVGGLIYFQGNIVSEQQVTDMIQIQQRYAQERIGLPLFIGIDEEGGQVTRIASCDKIDVPQFPDISEIGASLDSSQAYEVGDAIGTYLSRMGFNLDFAPVADVLTNPDNIVVKRRAYGSDPQMVSEMVVQNLAGLEAHQVYGCIKHFPGHGATLGDSHNGYAYTDKVWEELKDSDVIPFEKSIDQGVAFIMVGHISLPEIIGSDVPASCSETVIQEFLRGELGYDGIVLTDALNMGAITQQYTSAQAAVKAIQAGNDMLLMPVDFRSAYQGVLDALQEGRISEERLDESIRRILEIKIRMDMESCLE